MTTKDVIEKYISYRRSLGEQFMTESYTLKSFGRSVGEETALCSVSTKHTLDYIFKDSDKRTAVCYKRNSILRGFFTWAVSRGHLHESPLPALNIRYPQRQRPYIYTSDELKRIFSASLTYQKRRSIMYPEMVFYALVFTYSMGLRIRETLKIELGDINLSQSYIHIKQTKFYKSRLVTFNNAVKAKLIECLKWRKSAGMPDDSKDLLLLDRKNRPITIHNMDASFIRIREKVGVKCDSDNRHQPHIHSLRHTFAVNRIAAWYREGKDVQKMLPILSIYMGHTNLDHTAAYITMTDDLLNEANRLFEEFTNK